MAVAGEGGRTGYLSAGQYDSTSFGWGGLLLLGME